MLSGSLPPGLTLSLAGNIGGQPLSSGISTFTVQVTDSSNPALTATRQLSINVLAQLAVTTTSLPTAVAGVPYSQNLAATGGTAPYEWSVTGGSLPGGLTLSLAGNIGGQPLSPGTFTFTVQATDASNPAMTATQQLSISVVEPLAVTTTSLPGAVAGTPYSQNLAASGGTAPYEWSVVGGSLPGGLTLSLAGNIGGNPQSPGTSTFTVQVTDASNPALTATRQLSISIVEPLDVTTTSLPGAVTGTPYSQNLAATGGTAPYEWSVIGGSLPGGLTLSLAGNIGGNPQSPGTSTFTVQVTDASNPALTATEQLSITVVAPLSVATTSLPGATVGVPYSQNLAATGGTAPYEWSVVSGSLPGGLTLSLAGNIGGQPQSTGTSSFTVQVTDASNPSLTATRQLSITVVPAPLVITTTSLPGAGLGTAYSQTLAATGGTTPYTWSLLSGALPVGLGLNGATGVVSGTPTVAGTFTFTVQLTDSSSPTKTATQALSIQVEGCQTTVSGTVSKPLAIGSGTTCLQGATVNGPVTIAKGAVVSIVGSKVQGPLTASSATSVALCGTSVSGSISITGSTGPVLLGGEPGCAADTVSGPVTLSGNTGGVTLSGATVNGPVSVTNNSGGSLIAGNHVGGPLACSGNAPPPTDGGSPNVTSGPASGQCAKLT